MGSQLTKNYDVEKDPQTLGGINGTWKIYSAHKRDRLRTPVSIFIFDKKVLEKRRTDRDEIVERLKQEATALTRLRHPGVLKVLEPLMEDNKMLAFVTEPIEFCLGDLLRRPNLIESYLCDLEARLGLLDLIKALGFLHSEARQVHLALSPDNIYIAENGKWRLGGLAFAQQMHNEQRVLVPDSIDILQGARSMRYEQGGIGKLSPLVYYTAPEVLTEKYAYPESDIFSLACTIYSVYKAIFDKTGDLCLLKIDEVSASSHRTACINLLRSANSLNVIPESMREFIARMLNLDISSRPSLYEFSVNKAFQDSFIKAIYYLENIQEKPDTQKVQFLKGLSQIMTQFDKVIMQKRILPALISLMHIETLTGSLLPNILAILKCCNIHRDNFQTSIWPAISRLSTGKEISAQTLYIILSEADLLIGYTNPDQWKTSLLPLVYKAYDCGVPQIQELAMSKTPDLVNKVDDKIFIKVQILPRFLQGLMKAKSPKVKEKALQALYEIYTGFDKSTLLDTILPALEKIKKQDLTGNMAMHMLDIYEGIGKTLGPKTIATHILPALLPMLVETEFSKQQFEKLCQVLDNLIQKVKEVRIVELASMEEAQESNPIDDFFKPQEKEIHIDLLFQDLFGENDKKNSADMFGGMIQAPVSQINLGGSTGIMINQPTKIQTPATSLPPAGYSDTSQLGKVSNPFSSMPAKSHVISAPLQNTSNSGMNFPSAFNPAISKISPPAMNPPILMQSDPKPKGGMELFNNLSLRKPIEETKTPVLNATTGFSSDPFAELGKPVSSNQSMNMGLPGFSGYPEQSQKLPVQVAKSNNPFNRSQIKTDTEDFFSEFLTQGPTQASYESKTNVEVHEITARNRKSQEIQTNSVYELNLIIHSRTYTTFKRYSEFRELKHSLDSKLSHYSLKFPTKRWPAPTSSTDIEYRQRALEIWINSVLMVDNCRIPLMISLGMDPSDSILFTNSLICEPCKLNRSEYLITIFTNRITANSLKKGKALVHFESDFFESKKIPSQEKFKVLSKHLAQLCGENGIGSKALDILYKLMSRAHYTHFESFLAEFCNLNLQSLADMKLDLHILKKYGGDSSQEAFEVLKILHSCFSSDLHFITNVLNRCEEASKLYLNWCRSSSEEFSKPVENINSNWITLDCENVNGKMKICYRLDKGKLELTAELVINAELERIVKAITSPEDRKKWDYRLYNMTTADTKEDSSVDIYEYRCRSGIVSMIFDRRVIRYDNENIEIEFKSRKSPDKSKGVQDLITTKYMISSNHSPYTSFLSSDEFTPFFGMESPVCCKYGESCFTLKYTSVFPLSCLKYMIDEISQETDYLNNAWSRLKFISEDKEIPSKVEQETPNLLMEALRRKTGMDYKRLSF